MTEITEITYTRTAVNVEEEAVMDYMTKHEFLDAVAKHITWSVDDLGDGWKKYIGKIKIIKESES